MPLTSTGYSPLRAADYEALIKARLEAELGVTLAWGDTSVLRALAVAVAVQLGEVDAGTQAIYDAMNPENATGRALDNLCLILGITRNAATYSTATVTFTGTVGTTIPRDTLAEGGGSDGRARWRGGPGTVGSGGTVDLVLTAEDAGAVEADAGAIDMLVTPIAGITAISNVGAATPGVAAESDAALRLRRLQALQQPGSGSLAALRAALLEVEGVTAAAAVDNPTEATATVEGLSLTPHSIGVVILPNPVSDTVKAEVCRTIYSKLAAGIATNGAISGTVIGVDGYGKTIRFAYGANTSVDIDVILTLEAGYTLAEVQTSVEDAITAHVAGLSLGDALRRLVLFGLVDGVEGIQGATIDLDGVASDVEVTLSERITLGTLTVSEA